MSQRNRESLELVLLRLDEWRDDVIRQLQEIPANNLNSLKLEIEEAIELLLVTDQHLLDSIA